MAGSIPALTGIGEAGLTAWQRPVVDVVFALMANPAMRDLGLEFHHIGLAVRAPDAARLFLESLGYAIGEAVFDPEQNVHLLMCRHPEMPEVEVIYPAQSGKTPVDGLVSQHRAGIVYHACYRSNDLAASLAAIEHAGLHVVCVSPPKPAVLFSGERVSFYMVAGMGLIEILEQAE